MLKKMLSVAVLTIVLYSTSYAVASITLTCPTAEKVRPLLSTPSGNIVNFTTDQNTLMQFTANMGNWEQVPKSNQTLKFYYANTATDGSLFNCAYAAFDADAPNDSPSLIYVFTEEKYFMSPVNQEAWTATFEAPKLPLCIADPVTCKVKLTKW